jgi:hypothetical protein
MAIPILLGITGKKRSGKGTITAYLQKTYGFKEYHFSKPIKEGLMAMFGLTRDQVYKGDRNEIIPGLGMSIRDLMTSLANDWGHDMVTPDIWLLPAKVQIMTHKELGTLLLISDVRRDNEAELIHDADGLILEVTSRHTNKIRPDHKIESGISSHLIDETVHWSGTYAYREELYIKLDKFMATIRRD